MRLRKLILTLSVGVILLASCAAPSVAPAPEQATPTPTPTPTPTAVPTIRDFDIYPEDKVAIERAEADIELNRKGNVLLTITDSRGRPAPGLSVKYELVKHSFLFGVFEP